jgi:hypothetical protein
MTVNGVLLLRWKQINQQELNKVSGYFSTAEFVRCIGQHVRLGLVALRREP